MSAPRLQGFGHHSIIVTVQHEPFGKPQARIYVSWPAGTMSFAAEVENVERFFVDLGGALDSVRERGSE